MSGKGNREQSAAGFERWPVLLALLAGSAWLALFAEKPAASDASALSLPVRSAPSAGQTATLAPAPTAQAPDARIAADVPTLVDRALLIPDSAAQPDRTRAPRDLFAARQWNPPPAPVAPIEPPAPQAPPLPFVAIGKKLEAEHWEVYLAQGERNLIAREGAVIDGTYRVDRIAPPQMQLTYLPLGQAQTLPIGDTR